MKDTPVAAAHRCLETAHVSVFPIDLRGILNSLGVGCLSFTEIARDTNCSRDDIEASIGSRDGVVQRKGAAYTIAYNDRQAPARVRFTIAHELGHIVCDHLERTDNSQEIKRAYDASTYLRMENEANSFSCGLLAPPAAYEVWKSPDERYVQKYAGWYFGISKSCAYNRAKHLVTDIEELVHAGLYEKQREILVPFIEKYPLGLETNNKCMSNKPGSKCGVYHPPGIRICPLCGSVTRSCLTTIINKLDSWRRNELF